jgi:tetratricopeptide (TPR) repeat protein
VFAPVTVDQVLHSVTPEVRVDRPTLERLLSQRPHGETVVPLVCDEDVLIVRAAIIYLGVYGTMQDCALLALCLRHADQGVAAVAEYALWSVWMQAGGQEANRRLAFGIRCIERDNWSGAVHQLTRLVADEPTFAEAHFQRGVALSVADLPTEAGPAFREALRLNPYHFAAAAALGHVCVDKGDLAGALHYYRRALRIHPRLEGLPQAVRDLEAAVERR